MHLQMRRKTYLLLELLIAFTILSLCALPLVRNPMHMAKEEIAAFERMELERVAELAYAELLEKFYRNEIPWKTLDPKTLPDAPALQETVTLELPGIFKRAYEKKIFLWTRGEKKGPDEQDVRLIGVKIVFVPADKAKKWQKSFSYRVLLEIKAPSSPSTDPKTTPSSERPAHERQ